MTEAQILEDRLAQIQALALSSGSHEEFERGMCVMEAVSYVAGEPWSDHPECACQVLTSFMVAWNDALPSDEERDRLLKPLIPRLVGTRSTDEVAERRSYMALDWLIRVHTPAFLDLVPALHEHAKALRDLDAIVDMAGATAAGTRVRAAWAAAGAAARDAAGAAAWAAAGDAAWAASGAAAWAAAGDAAWAASGDAARDASGAAAWDASGRIRGRIRGRSLGRSLGRFAPHCRRAADQRARSFGPNDCGESMNTVTFPAPTFYRPTVGRRTRVFLSHSDCDAYMCGWHDYPAVLNAAEHTPYWCGWMDAEFEAEMRDEAKAEAAAERKEYE